MSLPKNTGNQAFLPTFTKLNQLPTTITNSFLLDSLVREYKVIIVGKLYQHDEINNLNVPKTTSKHYHTQACSGNHGP